MLRSPLVSGPLRFVLLVLLSACFSCDLDVIPDDTGGGPITETPTYESLDPGRGVANGMDVLANGGLLLTGSTAGEVYLQRTDVEGVVNLDRTYPNTGQDNASAVLQLSDGTYVVVGSTFNTTTGFSETFYLRTRADGSPLQGPLSLPPLGNSTESLDKVIELSDGSLLMIGSTYDLGSGNRDIFLLRASPSLASIYFQKAVTLPDAEWGTDVIALEDGFIVVGQIFTSSSVADGLFARFDLNGELFTNQPKRFTGINGTAFRTISRIAEGKYVIGGFASPTSNSQVLVVQTDVNGVAASGFPKVFGQAGQEYIFSSQATADGGLILAGGVDNDALLVKLDANSEESWRIVSGVSSDDGFTKVVTMPDGGYGVCGYRGESLYYAKTNDQGRVE